MEKTDDDIVISIKMGGLTPELTALITYKLTSKYILENTILQGLLSTQVSLEKDTSYVLQVIDSTKPKMDSEVSLGTSNVQGQTSGLKYDFNQYLFFHTGSTEEVFDINVFGLSFGYKLYHAERDENDDIHLLQLRSISSPVQAKVFLFKSDLPWIVNKNGTVVGLNSVSLEIPQEASRTCQSGILTKEEIQEAFSEAPVVDIKNSQLIVWLPDTGNTDTQWKYADLWTGTRMADNAPAICRQIRLFALRDFLITEERDYNNQEINTRRGIIRTLQRNQQNKSDHHSPVLESDVFTGFGKIAPITVGDITTGQTYISLDFNKGATTNDNGENELVINENNGVVSVSMPLLSLLGYNYEFCKDQGHLGSSSINPYQYTSVCFAWGYERKSGVFSLISGCSQPVLIDRGLVSISKNEDSQIVLTFGDVAAYKEKTPYYGDQDVFCVRAKDIEVEEATEE